MELDLDIEAQELSDQFGSTYVDRVRNNEEYSYFFLGIGSGRGKYCDSLGLTGAAKRQCKKDERQSDKGLSKEEKKIRAEQRKTGNVPSSTPASTSSTPTSYGGGYDYGDTDEGGNKKGLIIGGAVVGALLLVIGVVALTGGKSAPAPAV